MRKHRQIGYQEALVDLMAAFERGGAEEALEWIANNSHDGPTILKAFAEMQMMKEQ